MTRKEGERGGEWEGEGDREEDEETITINSIRRNLCFPRERSNC